MFFNLALTFYLQAIYEFSSMRIVILDSIFHIEVDGQYVL